MRKTLLLLMALFCTILVFPQGAKNIKINEVLTNNEESLQDEFGRHLPWIELANTSFSTYNVRGMYITTDPAVLDKSLTAPKRIAKMYMIPNEDDRTSMQARTHLIFFLNSNPSKGTLHFSNKVDPHKPIWIALYDGNGIDLIDSVTVPILEKDKSYARIKDGFMKWDIKTPDAVTPGIGNYIEINETKVAKLKREDPYGIGITVLSMGIVFFSLTLLFAFFSLLGKLITSKRIAGKNKESSNRSKSTRIPISASESSAIKSKKSDAGIEEIYIAVISMALKQYQDNMHDEESGIITILPHRTMWNKDF